MPASRHHTIPAPTPYPCPWPLPAPHHARSYTNVTCPLAHHARSPSGMAWHGMAWHGMAWHGSAHKEAPAVARRARRLRSSRCARVVVQTRRAEAQALRQKLEAEAERRLQHEEQASMRRKTVRRAHEGAMLLSPPPPCSHSALHPPTSLLTHSPTLPSTHPSARAPSSLRCMTRCTRTSSSASASSGGRRRRECEQRGRPRERDRSPLLDAAGAALLCPQPRAPAICGRRGERRHHLNQR
jgi:hypothetical protein